MGKKEYSTRSTLGFPPLSLLPWFPPSVFEVCVFTSVKREGGLFANERRKWRAEKRWQEASKDDGGGGVFPLPKKGELKRFSTIFFPPVLTFGGSAGVKSHLTLSTPSSSNASTFAPFGTRHH